MLTLLKFIALCSVLAMEAWLLWHPIGWEFKWDALAGFFGALLALFLLERKDQSTECSYSASSVSPTDIAVFERILALLDPNRVIAFLRNHDFGGPFSGEDIAPLRAFVDEGKNPDREFIDPRLENERQQLLESASNLSTAIATKTAPISVDHYSVLPKHLVNQPRPDWIVREAKELNVAATEFITLYDDFIRSCRARIAKSHVQ